MGACAHSRPQLHATAATAQQTNTGKLMPDGGKALAAFCWRISSKAYSIK